MGVTLKTRPMNKKLHFPKKSISEDLERLYVEEARKAVTALFAEKPKQIIRIDFSLIEYYEDGGSCFARQIQIIYTNH